MNTSNNSIETEIVKVGTVGVDSGQLMICDPCYIDSEWQTHESEDTDHAHDIFIHKDGSLWQFCYGSQPIVPNVNAFPGTYADVIPQYNASPNDMIRNGVLISNTGTDPRPHISDGEFSYRGICKGNKDNGTQLNYLLGHPGVAVAFSSGFGDGSYDVYAEIVNLPAYGKRVKKVWVELITDEEINDIINQ